MFDRLMNNSGLKIASVRNAGWKLLIRSLLVVRAVLRLFQQKKPDAVRAFIE
jgi:hypothetical protein